MPDDIVIGAGVYGMLVALELARLGRQVQVLEAGSVACGASGGPGRRGVRANGRDLRELPLMRQAYRRWPVLEEELGSQGFYQRTGHLLLLERDDDLASADARVQMQRNQGIDCRLVAGVELAEIQTGLSQDIKAGIYCAKDGVCDHGGFTRAVADRARNIGVVVQEDTAISHFETHGDSVTAVITAKGESIAFSGNLFVLANSGAHELVKTAFNLQLPVWNACLQVMITEPFDRVHVDTVLGHAHRMVSIKAEPDKRLMISGGWHGAWDVTSQRGSVLPSAVEGNLAQAIAVFPELQGVEVARTDADHLEAMSVDDIPIIDRVPGIANGYVATGWSGHGWAIAPVVATLIVKWALSRERSELLAPFVLKRFGIN